MRMGWNERMGRREGYVLNYYELPVHETDTSLDFRTVEKVAVSLPTKYLSSPTSGSALICDFMSHRQFSLLYIYLEYSIQGTKSLRFIPWGRSIPSTPDMNYI